MISVIGRRVEEEPDAVFFYFFSPFHHNTLALPTSSSRPRQTRSFIILFTSATPKPSNSLQLGALEGRARLFVRRWLEHTQTRSKDGAWGPIYLHAVEEERMKQTGKENDGKEERSSSGELWRKPNGTNTFLFCSQGRTGPI